MLEDLGTYLATEQYISRAGRHANSLKLANVSLESTAITLYLVSVSIRPLLSS